MKIFLNYHRQSWLTHHFWCTALGSNFCNGTNPIGLYHGLPRAFNLIRLSTQSRNSCVLLDFVSWTPEIAFIISLGPTYFFQKNKNSKWDNYLGKAFSWQYRSIPKFGARIWIYFLEPECILFPCDSQEVIITTIIIIQLVLTQPPQHISQYSFCLPCLRNSATRQPNFTRLSYFSSLLSVPKPPARTTNASSLGLLAHLVTT